MNICVSFNYVCSIGVSFYFQIFVIQGINKVRNLKDLTGAMTDTLSYSKKMR